MSSPHVPVSWHLRLPPQFEDVPGYLRLIDPDLRMRRSAERPDIFILERRCRRAPAVNVGMRDMSDMHVQARDGYIHVASVHPNWLTKPWNILRTLKEEGADLWATGGSQKYASEQEYEEQWQRETRKRRRLGLYRDIAKDGYDTLNRLNMGGERSRISNAGTRPHSEFIGRTA